MKPTSKIRLPEMCIVLAAVILPVSYSESKAASLSNGIDATLESEVLHQQGTGLPARDYLTHDNGNYHRYHFNNAQQHTQPGRSVAEGQDKRRLPHKFSDRSNLRFRRYHDFPRYRHFSRYQHFPHGRFIGGFHYGHSNRKFINTIVGGAVLYRLFR